MKLVKVPKVLQQLIYNLLSLLSGNCSMFFLLKAVCTNPADRNWQNAEKAKMKVCYVVSL